MNHCQTLFAFGLCKNNAEVLLPPETNRSLKGPYAVKANDEIENILNICTVDAKKWHGIYQKSWW